MKYKNGQRGGGIEDRRPITPEGRLARRVDSILSRQDQAVALGGRTRTVDRQSRVTQYGQNDMYERNMRR